MEKCSVALSHVSVRFRLYVERSDTLKETFIKLLKRRNQYRDLWALNDVSLHVRPGESVGLVGRNGSGKSTLLKIVAGVFHPTAGTVHVGGRVAPLIELGAGFNGELTGRENVFLNGAILGRSYREMCDLYDEIVEFAELRDFMDVPVKNYSSGMYARLGFSIATAINGDVLLVDEVLAVGDESFQGKCILRLEKLLSDNKAVLFVSHDASAVERICGRAMLLDHGTTLYDGPTSETLREYRRLLHGSEAPALCVGA